MMICECDGQIKIHVGLFRKISSDSDVVTSQQVTVLALGYQGHVLDLELLPDYSLVIVRYDF